jgi:hypothetical protein
MDFSPLTPLRRASAFVALAMFALVSAAAGFAAEAPAAARAREMLTDSLTFSERLWDDQVGLLWSAAPGEERRAHRVRESAWFALGLLVRGAPGDETRAIRIVEHVLDFQFVAPGQPWDGTFRRAPEEPPPAPGAELWKNYDPNWRQFIGTTFALMLEQHADRLPAALQARLIDSIRRAIEGELTQGRAEPYHTNVSLMHGFLLGWAGQRLGRADWVAQSEQWIERVREDFARHGSFDEYNSPTYYGVDFYGLALCRRYGATEKIRAAGAEMEAGLWRDVARFYHAGLQNLSGPFDRAYGLDMRRYVSLVGVWMGLVLPRELTPLPDPAKPMGHAHDFAAAPLYVALGVRVPDDAMAALRTFQGERTLECIITGERRATAWIGERVMLGGEITGQTRDAGPRTRYGQFHPAVAHWRIGEGYVGAFALVESPAVDARASAGRLAIDTAKGDARFRFSVPGLTPAMLGRDAWHLPGLDVKVDTDATAVSVEGAGDAREIVYRAATRVHLSVVARP